MKRNISDLLDNLPVEDMELEDMSLLSARRIKKKTMNKIVAPRSRSVRWLWRVAAVAAVVAAMGITAFAAGVAMDGENPVAAYVSRIFGKDLTEQQAEAATQVGKVYENQDKPLYGDNGIKITPIAAIADDLMLYMYIHVEAPDGVTLPDCTEDGMYYAIHGVGPGYDHGVTIGTAGTDMVHTVNMGFDDVLPLHDADPTDNEKDFVIRMICNGDVTFNDGMPKYLRFGSLWLHDRGHEVVPTHKDVTGKCSRITDGDFRIDVNCGYKDAKIVVDTGEVTYYDEEYDFTTVIKKVTVTPLHIEVDCTSTACDEKYIFPHGGPVQIVMKDGTVIQALAAYYDARANGLYHPDSICGVCSFDWFDDLLVLEDIDYLIVGDGEIFDVN